jgi:predicted nucleic acid-binding protein
MARMTVLLDSNILIDHLNGISEATDYLRLVHGTAAISVITRAEVLAGVKSADQEEKVTKFLGLFATLPVTMEVADEVALFRKQGLKFPDATQAAIASLNKLKLATRNTRDFTPARFPDVLVPYTLTSKVGV